MSDLAGRVLFFPGFALKMSILALKGVWIRNYKHDVHRFVYACFMHPYIMEKDMLFEIVPE